MRLAILESFWCRIARNLGTIRIVVLQAKAVPGIVDDGEWNWYIKQGAGEHVEITDREDRDRIIDFVNNKRESNIHRVSM